MERYIYFSEKLLKCFIFAAILCMVACNNDEGEISPPPVSYKLCWSDEFDSGLAINRNDWNIETGGHGWGNNELQYYHLEYVNVDPVQGMLRINATKFKRGDNEYISARINTKGKHFIQYGKIEARIKMPMANGSWPAFWMLGENISSAGWPACGEIDIMEQVNNKPEVTGNMFWFNSDGDTAQYYNGIITTPSDFHVYSLEWDSAKIRWFCDGIKFHEADIIDNKNGTEEFHKPFYIVLNLAIGGNGPNRPVVTPVDESSFPWIMYVDYVRLYSADGVTVVCQ